MPASEYRAIEGYVHKFRLEGREELGASSAAPEPGAATVSLGALLGKFVLVAIVLLALAATFAEAQAAGCIGVQNYEADGGKLTRIAPKAPAGPQKSAQAK